MKFISSRVLWSDYNGWISWMDDSLVFETDRFAGMLPLGLKL